MPSLHYFPLCIVPFLSTAKSLPFFISATNFTPPFWIVSFHPFCGPFHAVTKQSSLLILQLYISLLKWFFHTHHVIHITVAFSFQSLTLDNISLKCHFCCLSPWWMPFTHCLHVTLHFLSFTEYGAQSLLAGSASYIFTTYTFTFHSRSYI